MNFLYCIDSNYNLQCYISICSLLKFSDKDLTVHIIHKEKESFKPFISKLSNSNNNITIKLYQLEANLNFPEFSSKLDRHLSEATYYRLYISNYLEDSIKNILYLDADVFAVNSFEEIVFETFSELNDSDLVIGAYDVVNYNKNTNLKPYFNAGVLFIDYEKWTSQNITKMLLLEYEKNSNLKYHDQDLMNNYFKDNFLNIYDYLNLHINLDNKTIKTYKEELSSKAIFVHYVGAEKPWINSGMLKLNSFFYHDLIKEFNNGDLNLNKTSIYNAIKFFTNNIHKIFFSKEYFYYMKNVFYQLKR